MLVELSLKLGPEINRQAVNRTRPHQRRPKTSILSLVSGSGSVHVSVSVSVSVTVFVFGYSCKRWQKFIVCENVLTSLKSSLSVCWLPSWIYICVLLIVWSSYRAWRFMCSYPASSLILQSDFHIFAAFLPVPRIPRGLVRC